MLDRIRAELSRLAAEDAKVVANEDYEPEAGELTRLTIGGAYWHIPPMSLLQVLRGMADGAGSDAVKQEIERQGSMARHGPAPPNTRDMTP